MSSVTPTATATPSRDRIFLHGAAPPPLRIQLTSSCDHFFHGVALAPLANPVAESGVVQLIFDFRPISIFFDLF